MDETQTQVAPQEVAPQESQPQQESPPWSGELTALEKEQWYAGLDENTRKALRGGVETRLKAYEKGVQSKLQTWSAEKKDLETRISRAERASKLYEQLAQGEEDPRVAEADAKLASLQEQLASLSGERDTYKTRLEQREVAEAQAEAQKVLDAYPDIMGDEAAFGRFHRLLSAGMDTDEASRVVRALHPDLEVAPKIPKDVALMSRGDGASGRAEVPGAVLPWKDRLDAAAAKAMRLHGAE
jgi:flagellar motility protein MotE (MotC chaperone)